MPETDQLEEIVFEAPTGQQPVVLNPDVFLRGLRGLPEPPEAMPPPFVGGCIELFLQRGRGETHGRKIKPLLCIACMVGQCGKCAEGDCPCVHHDCQRENAPTLDSSAEDFCWQV